MRAYVITVDDHVLEHKTVDSVVSSRKAAITRLNGIVGNNKVKLREEGKHEGQVVFYDNDGGGHTVEYEMFFINR